MMRWLLKFGTLTAVLFSLSVSANPFTGYRAVDLTHAFDENTIYWPTEKGFQHDKQFEGVTEGGWYYTAYSVRTAEHGGTHLDAPIHFAADTWTADEVPLSSLIRPAVVIDGIDEQLVNKKKIKIINLFFR